MQNISKISPHFAGSMLRKDSGNIEPRTFAGHLAWSLSRVFGSWFEGRNTASLEQVKPERPNFLLPNFVRISRRYSLFLSNVLWDLKCLRFSFYYSGPVSMHFSKALCLIKLISNCVFDYCTLLLWGGALLVFISVKKEPWFWHKYTDVEVADP